MSTGCFAGGQPDWLEKRTVCRGSPWQEKGGRVSNHDRSLDVWYVTINKIYLDRNYYRTPESIFAHVVEV